MSQTKDSSFLHFNEGEVTSRNAVNYGINPNHTSSHQVTLSKTIISQKQPPNINEQVRISDDEYVIKDYNAAKVKKPTKGEAHVALTNKRAIIYYWTQKGVLVNDARITEVLGTNVFWAKRQRRKLGTTAIALGILSMVACLFIIPMLMPGSILVGAPLIAVGIY